MLEETILRIESFIPQQSVRIVSGESMSKHILTSVDYIKQDQVLCEPRPRNTCLAVGLAAIHLTKEDPHAVMVVLSADHLVRPAERLMQIIEDGCAIASVEDKLITIGIAPTRPETGYGYIKIGEPFSTERKSQVFQVGAFAEKPKAVVAQEYYYSRKYLWNSGMFVWSAKAILRAIKECQPEMSGLLNEYSKAIGTGKEVAARAELYEKAISISIDYAVLEKTRDVLAIKADIVWDDVGSWGALERYKELDSDNNVVIGDCIARDTFETTIYNDSDGVIATLGVSDLVVVCSQGITLVAHKAKLGQIKDLLAEMGKDDKFKKYL